KDQPPGAGARPGHRADLRGNFGQPALAGPRTLLLPEHAHPQRRPLPGRAHLPVRGLTDWSGLPPAQAAPPTGTAAKLPRPPERGGAGECLPDCALSWAARAGPWGGHMTLTVNAARAGETWSAGGADFRILADGSAVDRRWGLVECTLAPAWGGPPQHVHR